MCTLALGSHTLERIIQFPLCRYQGWPAGPPFCEEVALLTLCLRSGRGRPRLQLPPGVGVSPWPCQGAGLWSRAESALRAGGGFQEGDLELGDLKHVCSSQTEAAAGLKPESQLERMSVGGFYCWGTLLAPIVNYMCLIGARCAKRQRCFLCFVWLKETKHSADQIPSDTINFSRKQLTQLIGTSKHSCGGPHSSERKDQEFQWNTR